MLVSIPVINACQQRLSQLVDIRKAPSIEGQRTQLLPPRLNQIEPRRILGNELNLNFGPSEQGSLDIFTMMRRQVVLNNQPTLGRKLPQHAFEQAQMRVAIALGREQNGSLPTRRFKGAMHPEYTAPTIVRFKGGASIAPLP